MDARSLAFLRVVEVFPPIFPLGSTKKRDILLEEEIESFVEGVRSIRTMADIFLVANVKNHRLLKLSTVQASSLLHERLRVDTAPVIVARDMNQPQFLSTVLTAISLNLGSMMIAWGDDYPASAQATNVRDFASLGDAITEAAQIRRRAGSSIQILAPVDLNGLSTSKGISLAKRRLRAGANYLLAQPPTTDAGRTFDNHASVLETSGMNSRILLNVFPFRDETDVKKCERYFGWKLPRSLYETAAAGEESLIKEERKIIRRLRAEKFPGVYLTTRGTPGVAKRLLS
jgi:5,10-methylenetetrahydrofolate reductase